jgi:hypothetical protein
VNGETLLGQSFLSRFKSWSIDNEQHVLILVTSDPSRLAPAATSNQAKICSQEFEVKRKNGDLPANADSGGYLGWCLKQ